jgi:hypothetical protein
VAITRHGDTIGYFIPARRKRRGRMISRDIDDRPLVATSLLLRCAIWTEDRDFFGSGVPTWTNDTVELYSREA